MANRRLHSQESAPANFCYVEVALEYLCLSIHQMGLSFDSGICYDAAGRAIPPRDIEEIEVDPQWP